VPPELSPTARALRALELLQSRPGTTADELASRLGVTERAARRYVGILREAGIPVESTRGPYGGYRLGRGTRLPPVAFTQAEALALVLAVLGSPSAAADDDVVGAALGKVIRALPEGVGRQAASLREHATTTPDPYSALPDPAVTSSLVGAIAARRCVRVAYRSESGDEWEAEVDPWAVVARFGRWYLLCRSHRADAVRTYRVDRIRGVAETDQRFEPPNDLDPVTVLEANLGAGWEHATRVVFEAPVEVVARWVRPPMGRLEPLGEGCVLVGTTSNPTMYADEWLARLPLRFRVEGGAELRAATISLASRLAAAVEPTDG
jgi:predicted DNA-binding transcriptional regulator YafY